MLSTHALNNWKKLFEVADAIKQLKPWEMINEEHFFVIHLKNRKEPVVASITGSHGQAPGIILFHTPKSQKNLSNLMFETPDVVDPISFEPSTQEALACYFSNRDELSNEEYQLAKELGYSFRGKHQWVHFATYIIGRVPQSLNAEEVTLATDVLEQLYPILHSICLERNNVPLFQHIKNDKGHLTSFVAPYDLYEINKEKPSFFDNELLIHELKKQPQINVRMELTYIYTNTTDDDGHVMALILGAEATDKFALIQDIQPGHISLVPSVIEQLVEFIKTTGRPKKIFVRLDDLFYQLQDFCQKLGIELVFKEDLPAIEDVCVGIIDLF